MRAFSILEIIWPIKIKIILKAHICVLCKKIFELFFFDFLKAWNWNLWYKNASFFEKFLEIIWLSTIKTILKLTFVFFAKIFELSFDFFKAI